ncbi:MAG: A/G-specific adenine glycosylase [Candidatus Sungbacteria bacterium]|nr:A/G-specific adenine glycosylase [bacterium]MDZ4260483.1 A/G-specific adenine glycosylase [Candidatus Sungbacteria bacterium]
MIQEPKKIPQKLLLCIHRIRHLSHHPCGISAMQKYILQWYKKHTRDNLPWRWTNMRPVDPYQILVSEIMLQQTQVPRVLDKFPKFITAFPTMKHLAAAPLDTVLREWQGMGYNRRGLYLKQCAQKIMKQFNGKIPSDPSLLATLPGIGPYTSGAISCFAFNQPVIFLDTNIRKFFLHYFFSDTKRKISDKEIFLIAQRLLYKKNPRVWNYALMDYGALMLASKPDLLSRATSYHKQSPFLGSNRFFRSQIVQYLLKHKKATRAQLQKTSPRDIRPLLASLCKEGIVRELTLDRFTITES